MTSLELATDMAKEAGFDIAVFEKEWNGYEVFYGDLILEEGQPAPCLGLPYYMLVKNGKIRLSTADEKCEIRGLKTAPIDYTFDLEELMNDAEFMKELDAEIKRQREEDTE
jgi:hypothetical protein